MTQCYLEKKNPKSLLILKERSQRHLCLNCDVCSTILFYIHCQIKNFQYLEREFYGQIYPSLATVKEVSWQPVWKAVLQNYPFKSILLTSSKHLTVFTIILDLCSTMVKAFVCFNL